MIPGLEHYEVMTRYIMYGTNLSIFTSGESMPKSYPFFTLRATFFVKFVSQKVLNQRLHCYYMHVEDVHLLQ